MIRGFDASGIQGVLDAKALAAAGYRFGILKCQEGNKGKDGLFENNRAALMAEGIAVGAYNFVYPLPHLDPVAQAQLFHAASDCGSNTGELPVFVDFEWPSPQEWPKWGCSAAQIGQWFKLCMEEMRSLYGNRPIVYTYPWFIKALLQGGADLDFLVNYHLWMADYSHAGKEIADGMSPVIPEPWQPRGWLFWQHDGDKGLKLPNGVDADFDVFNGTEEEFQALIGNSPNAATDFPIIHDIPDLSGAAQEEG